MTVKQHAARDSVKSQFQHDASLAMAVVQSSDFCWTLWLVAATALGQSWRTYWSKHWRRSTERATSVNSWSKVVVDCFERRTDGTLRSVTDSVSFTCYLRTCRCTVAAAATIARGFLFKQLWSPHVKPSPWRIPNSTLTGWPTMSRS